MKKIWAYFYCIPWLADKYSILGCHPEPEYLQMTIDMHIESFDTAESIDYVTINIQAMLQWTKISFATLLSTFYIYFASNAWKCIHYCTHCRKLKSIHHYSYNLETLHFTTKNNSFCKTFTTYNPSKIVDTPLPYSMITDTATQFLGRNLWQNSLGWVTTYVRYFLVWAIFSCQF